jgi:hypothetical protein
MLAPGALHALAAAWARDPGADIVHGPCLVHRDGALSAMQAPRITPEGFSRDALADVFGNWMAARFFLQPEALVTRRLLARLGGRVDDRLHRVFDYELWLRAAAAGARPVRADWPAALYRLHPAQKTSDRRATALEQVAVREAHGLRPAPPPERARAVGAALARAFACRPLRLVLLDPRLPATASAEALAEGADALVPEGVALHASHHPHEVPAESGIVLRVLRAHDGSDWIGPLRAGGFAGPLVGWLVEDRWDIFANAALAQAVDLVLPAHAGSAAVLANGRAVMLPAACAAVCAAHLPLGEARRMFAAAGTGAREAGAGVAPLPWDGDPAARFAVRLARKVSFVEPTPEGGIPAALSEALLAGQVPVVPDSLDGLEAVIPTALQRSLPVLRAAPGTAAAALADAERAFDRGGPAAASVRHRFACDTHSLVARLGQILAALRAAARDTDG